MKQRKITKKTFVILLACILLIESILFSPLKNDTSTTSAAAKAVKSLSVK